MSPEAQRAWNTAQVVVLRRWSSLHRRPLNPDLVARLAERYAAKHGQERGS